MALPHSPEEKELTEGDPVLRAFLETSALVSEIADLGQLQV